VRIINVRKKDGKKISSSERISFEEFTAQQIISNNKKLKANEGKVSRASKAEKNKSHQYTKPS
jgi:hypothetical protein